MAVLLSENQLNYARKNYYGKFYVTKKNLNLIDKVINKILINIYLFKYTLVNIKRKFYRNINISLGKKSNQKFENFKINIDEKVIVKISNNLKLNNYTFVENFLSQESYRYLINSWPDINYFDHNKKIIKHYNSIAEWSDKKSFIGLNYSDNLRNFYKFLISKDFKDFYNNLINFEKKEYKISAISSSMASNGSFLIPHVDGVSKNTQTKQHYNFIYFVDGYDENPILGGGTGFYKDNEFKLPIFVPNTIKNSLVIYNQSESFFHGFRTIDCPKEIYRKTVNFQIRPNT
mgnify:FL=1